MESLEAAIDGVVAGDLRCLAAILTASHRALADAATQSVATHCLPFVCDKGVGGLA